MTEAITIETEPTQPLTSQWKDIWSQFRTHKGAMIGMAFFLLVSLAVILGPWLWLWHLEPNTLDIRNKNQGPSLAHPMGTDQLGRDTFASVLQGGRVSLLVGVTAMLLSLVLGTLVGALAGYFKKIDGFLMRFTDLFLALPLLPLFLVIIMLWRDTLPPGSGRKPGFSC